MWNTKPRVPCPVNEQKLEYNAGSDERKEIHLMKETIDQVDRTTPYALTISLSRGNLYPEEGKA